MPFLLNTWYLAAWSDEVGGETPLGRTIIERAVVMYRGADGALLALQDRCPHRFAPLSAGRVEAGVLRCGYHGLAFGPDGACVANPHGPVPASARVRSYPAVDRHGAVWIWMGELNRADPDVIPDLGFIDRTAPEARVKGHLQSRAHYQLMVDNIMDLSHADYLHPATLGGGINTRASSRVEESGADVKICWEAHGDALPPVMDAQLPRPGQPGDFFNEVHWSAPGIMRQRVLFGPAGALADAGQDSWTAHVMTPAGPDLTHYFFCHTSEAVSRDPSIAGMIRDILLQAFRGEDAPMLERQQGVIGGDDFWSLKPVMLSIDGGAVLARRRLDRMIADERAAASERTDTHG